MENRNFKYLLKARIFRFAFYQPCILTLSPHISLYVCLSVSSPEWFCPRRYLNFCLSLSCVMSWIDCLYTVSHKQTVWTPCPVCLPTPPYMKFQMFWRCPPYIGVVQDEHYTTPWGLIQGWCMQNLKLTRLFNVVFPWIFVVEFPTIYVLFRKWLVRVWEMKLCSWPCLEIKRSAAAQSSQGSERGTALGGECWISLLLFPSFLAVSSFPVIKMKMKEK